MKKINYHEFVSKIKNMRVGDTFNFYEEYEENSEEITGAYGVARVNMFDAEMIIINYFGGCYPFIIDVSLAAYPIDSEALRKYFDDCCGEKSDTIYIH